MISPDPKVEETRTRGRLGGDMDRMRTLMTGILAIGLAAPSVAGAVETLERVDSQVYEAAGDKAALAARANACINRLVKPISGDNAVTSADVANGMITASNNFRFTDHTMMIASPQQGRSTLKFEAREGRFRFAYTDIEVLYGDWTPVKVFNRKSGASVTEGLAQVSDKVATCIKVGPPKQLDW